MNYLNNRGLCEKLAAEYVLGTLRGPAARRFARLAGDHATVKLMVSEWEARLTPMAEAIPERAPPSLLWPSIAARIACHPMPMTASATKKIPLRWRAAFGLRPDVGRQLAFQL